MPQQTNGGTVPFANPADSAAARAAASRRSADAARAALCEQYELVSKSLDYLGMVVAAVLLNYYTVEAQKNQLFEALNGNIDALNPLDFFNIQFTSSVMILSASSFFSDVSHDALEQPQTDPALTESLELSDFVNKLVLLAAAVRIYNLLLTRSTLQSQAPAAQNAGEEEEEVEETEVI